ncbi:UNVERIFIED_CONTAM: hypothetical protein GTU68_038248 [Idotea baltica]|nr:hypothetical protein [Idotea baltica]
MKKNLEEWLQWQETLHLSEIDLGLERIGKVAKELGLLTPNFPIITVAGTNGKGSTVAFLDAILRAEGYKTGAYTSPHLINYNERIVLNGTQADDSLIVSAFEAIDKARSEISLTYFEFSTLAAIYIYHQKKVDVAILEVGLGGRLDAANLWDASLAIITSIGIDHIDWLGDDRDIIAVEKSGIMRADKPVISGELDPPITIKSEAQRIGAKLQQINTDFSYQLDSNSKKHWNWNKEETSIKLDLPNMPAIAGLKSINSTLPVSIKAINQGLKNTKVMGRLQVLQSNPEWLIDVAHNPHAAKQLAKYIKENPVNGKTYALFSMLRDKDIVEVIQLMDKVIDEWHIVATQGSRGLSLEALKDHFNQQSLLNFNEQKSKPSALKQVSSYKSFAEACSTMKNITKEEDRVVAFGSFLVISEILENCT